MEIILLQVWQRDVILLVWKFQHGKLSKEPRMQELRVNTYDSLCRRIFYGGTWVENKNVLLGLNSSVSLIQTGPIVLEAKSNT